MPNLLDFTDIPIKYLCPITRQIMSEPVIAKDGHTYEKEAIEKYFASQPYSIKISPITRQSISTELTINWYAKKDIADYLQQHPNLHNNVDAIYLPDSWKQQMIKAIKNNNIMEVNNLLDKNIILLTDELFQGYTAIHLAAAFGSINLIDTLLDKIIKLNKTDVILHKTLPPNLNIINLNKLLKNLLLRIPHSPIIQKKCDLLVKLGADIEQPDINNSYNTLLHKCIIKNNIKSVKWLINHGANIESCNTLNNTPLLLAVLFNHSKLSKILLNNNANPLAINNNNQSALFLAILNNNNIISYFINKDQAHLPPLHLALHMHNEQLFYTLLQYKRFIDLTDTNGNTALHISARLGLDVIVKSLLDAGANYLLTNNHGLSPLELAIINNQPATIKLLLSKTIETLKINLFAEEQSHRTYLELAQEEQFTKNKILFLYSLSPKLPQTARTNFSNLPSNFYRLTL
jgi:ankyrin repeat protein